MIAVMYIFYVVHLGSNRLPPTPLEGRKPQGMEAVAEPAILIKGAHKYEDTSQCDKCMSQKFFQCFYIYG